jgi:ankyrin repeat protein
VKQFGFAFLIATACVVSPASAQSLTTKSYDFIKAVKDSDGDKAIQVLSTEPKGIINTRDDDGNTGLIIAINRSDEQWTGFLLNKGADPNLPGKNGDTPLIAASRVGFEQAVEWLLGLGAKVDADNKMGETPLIVAVQQRQAPIVRLLLGAGANPDKSDSAAGYSARDYAKRDPRAREILKMIEDKKPKAATAAK